MHSMQRNVQITRNARSPNRHIRIRCEATTLGNRGIVSGGGMISPSQVEAMIKAGLPDAEVQIQDLTGGGDHYQAVIVSSLFEGKSLIQQHQMVYKAVNQAMSSEAIHALSLKTYTPQAWVEAGQKA
ncbi:BolA family protein [Leptolyngbya sp. AN02str]|uniref:BolA family protein n=1 Tax=Leptolyngbya sp. AN02str TaxID=3423363 RepID=UPI003D312460